MPDNEPDYNDPDLYTPLEEDDDADDYDPYDDPPCECWCEMCGCHGWCMEDIFEDYEDELDVPYGRN
jgi:hypothetical protein